MAKVETFHFEKLTADSAGTLFARLCLTTTSVGSLSPKSKLWIGFLSGVLSEELLAYSPFTPHKCATRTPFDVGNETILVGRHVTDDRRCAVAGVRR